MGGSGGPLGQDKLGVLDPPFNLSPNQEAPREERQGKALAGRRKQR